MLFSVVPLLVVVEPVGVVVAAEELVAVDLGASTLLLELLGLTVEVEPSSEVVLVKCTLLRLAIMVGPRQPGTVTRILNSHRCSEVKGRRSSYQQR